MWCNWGWMGGRMWWPHGFGFMGFLLVLVVVVFLLSLLRKKQLIPQKIQCPSCAGDIQAVYLRCPHCGTSLKHHCPKCAAIIEATWKYCPICESEINKIDR